MNILIMGYGHMGKRYASYLDSFGYKWEYFDPYVKGGVKTLININDYTHIIISTPPENHYECYTKLDKFNGSILLDKPVIINNEHIKIFDDKRTYYSLTERFNPAVNKLKDEMNLKEVISIDFVRNSNVNAVYWDIPVLFDLGIHDLDLYFHLSSEKSIPKVVHKFTNSKTYYVDAVSDSDILCKFMWSHESKKVERRIKVYQKNVVYEADLIDQTLIKYENDNKVTKIGMLKDQPVRESLLNFLNKNKIDRNEYKLSHQFMIDLMGDIC